MYIALSEAEGLIARSLSEWWAEACVGVGQDAPGLRIKFCSCPLHCTPAGPRDLSKSEQP